ncbi:hypothetical protein A9G29_11075 [Gilliamella sp. Fer2-1]|jgi:hypothetical protein|uniref:hypothetical protein n=1 Tax=unclassified Gilliamella TaxID=2685620 RepID=UPI00080F4948|nr:hypothetical protein [Gilliamella apicola]OCG38116.1 hypothetical protein A9G29_11075 [Gilliamella apicola]OCG66913.1 hypothetical protein A9G41_11880 [Gilliamella apicola]OCG79483.1 hypothetical protein A9G42_00275 [Gilliamella apicola]
MKIRNLTGTIIDVFAIYWFDDETLFLGLPKNHGGFIEYRATEVSVIEPHINFKTVYFENNSKGIFHWALIQESLLDNIIERNENAYKRFLEIIKSENLVNPGFY